MIWHIKHQVSDQIKENSGFWKNWMFRFAKPDNPVFSGCTVRQSVLLNQVQQNQTVWFLKSEGPEFPELGTNQAK
jgi:hypothetical protein